MDNFKKLDYILDTHMNATKVTQAFGFKSETMLSKMRKGKSNISQLHIDGLEKYFDIPTKLFEIRINDKNEIDVIIKAYRKKKKQEKEKEAFPHKLVKKLIEHDLLPKKILEQHTLDNEALEELIKKHKKDLELSATSPVYAKYENKIFKSNDKLFQKLKGVWYGYLYPSNVTSAVDGLWEVRTTINDDHSVIDYWGNKGYVKLGKHESMIIKESYDNDDLTIIRFPNRQVPSEHFRFTIISNQNNTHNEMVNFGFFSRKQYPKDEAKEILGDIDTKQLKLDLNFNEQLNERAIVPE